MYAWACVHVSYMNAYARVIAQERVNLCGGGGLHEAILKPSCPPLEGAADTRQPAGSSRQPPGSSLAVSRQLPAASRQLPAASRQLPAVSRQSPGSP